MQKLEKVQNCAYTLKKRLSQGFSPKVGIVLGTGLGDLGECLEEKILIPFSDLPNMPASTVQSHAGSFAAGLLSGVPVILQQGRSHLYEGRALDEVCFGVRVMGTLGVTTLMITNAAGALNPHFRVGDLMLMDDHLNCSGQSPLVGPNVDEWGPRFPDMSRAYDADLIRIAEEKALQLGIRLEKGVYACTLGPQLETRAETRAFRLLGADAVGMSTVPEVIAARHMGLRVLGISCLTNKNLPDCMVESSIEDIIAAAGRAAGSMAALIAAVVAEI